MLGANFMWNSEKNILLFLFTFFVSKNFVCLFPPPCCNMAKYPPNFGKNGHPSPQHFLFGFKPGRHTLTFKSEKKNKCRGTLSLKCCTWTTTSRWCENFAVDGMENGDETAQKGNKKNIIYTCYMVIFFQPCEWVYQRVRDPFRCFGMNSMWSCAPRYNTTKPNS